MSGPLITFNFNPPGQTYHATLFRGLTIGHDVAAFQLNLDAVGLQLKVDGDYGFITERGAMDWQRSEGLTPDGRIGPQSNFALARRLWTPARDAYSIVKGMVRSLVELESGYCIGAVNWNVPGGVDCSFTQQRVYNGEYSQARFVIAFTANVNFLTMCERLRQTKDHYSDDLHLSDREAWQYAGLFHNWQSGAEQKAHGTFDTWVYKARFLKSGPPDGGTLVRNLDDNWEERRYSVDAVAQWVINSSGGRRLTAREHADFYIAVSTLYVTKWTP